METELIRIDVEGRNHYNVEKGIMRKYIRDEFKKLNLEISVEEMKYIDIMGLGNFEMNFVKYLKVEDMGSYYRIAVVGINNMFIVFHTVEKKEKVFMAD